MKNIFKLHIALLSALLISACGGSGSGTPEKIDEPVIVSPPKTLIINGIVTDSPLSNAIVTIYIGSREVEVTADENGFYTVTLEINDNESSSMIKIIGTGVGNQDGAVLVSLLGTAADLIAQAGNDETLDADENFDVNITNVTTAEYSIIVKANNGVVPTTTDALTELAAEMDLSEVLNLSVIIKLVIDDPDVSFPYGVNNTLDLVMDDDLVNELVNEVPTTSAAYIDAFEEVVTDPALLAPQNITLPSILYTIDGDNTFYTLAWKFNSGVGSINADTFTYSVKGNVISGIYDLVSPLESYEEIFANGKTEYIDVIKTPKSFEITLISQQDNLINYSVKSVTEKVYDASTVTFLGIVDPSGEYTELEQQAALTKDAIINLPAMAGKSAFFNIAEYLYESEDGYVSMAIDSDELQFFSDGLGHFQKLDIEFTWLVDSENKIITINYEDDVNGPVEISYSVFEQEGVFDVVFKDTETGYDRAQMGPGLFKNTGDKIVFSTDDMPGIYMSPYNDPEKPLNNFWFELKENGDADTISTGDDNEDGVITEDEIYMMYGTWRVEDGKVVVTRVRLDDWSYDPTQRIPNGDNVRLFHERTWELIDKDNNNLAIMNTHNFTLGLMYVGDDQYDIPAHAQDVYYDVRKLDKLDKAPIDISAIVSAQNSQIAAKLLSAKTTTSSLEKYLKNRPNLIDGEKIKVN